MEVRPWVSACAIADERSRGGTANPATVIGWASFLSACGFRDPHPAGNASGRSSGSPLPVRLPASRQWLSDRMF